jgi:Carboxypeptidase regulatory-like domain
LASNSEESNPEPDVTDRLQVKAEVATPEVVVEKIAEGSIDGRVVTSIGPLLNATVSFGVIQTFTDDKGNFLLEHVPVGIGKIRVKPPTNRFYDLTQDILVEADKRKNLYLFLTEVTGKVEGIVSDENGKPLVGAEVWSVFRLAKPAESTKTDVKGHYVFEEIPPGSYYVRAKAEGHMIEGATVNVVGGSTIAANFKLNSGGLTISGIVVSKKDGAGVECQIYLLRKGTVVTTTKTSISEGGKYIFENLIPDKYEMSLVPADYSPKYWFGDVQKPEVVNFELE